MKMWKYLIPIIFLFSPLFTTDVSATESDSNELVGENEVKKENSSDYEVPSEEELKGITEMEVVENVNDKGQTFDNEALSGTKQFLTVVTPDGKTYYIVITYEQFGTTVNLLKDMSETDVQSVADNQPQAGNVTKSQAEKIMAKNAGSDTNSAGTTETKKANSVNWIVIIAAVVGVGGVVGFIKLRKNKSGGSDTNF